MKRCISAPPPAAESYLVADKIIAACLATGADAVHPGYGFLSERASFVEALSAAGIAFIGPPARRHCRDGRQDRIEAPRARRPGCRWCRALSAKSTAPTMPCEIAGGIGYPVMMKASAGGGGKGMRLAWSEADVREGFEASSARRWPASATIGCSSKNSSNSRAISKSS